eukprot:TRINITY_DN1623_c0_g2_i2.p1 TRINITY_DN1623_c0_g2~~TRINITY_DN1623_c0_g2_i2.p1  ORF type:complete len:370 (+),score=63.67 TRINITY_DN1623_c0_g2_i2:229-1338(+)
MPGVCGAKDCGKEASLQCPTCVSLHLPVSYFCSKDCFSKSWSEHKKAHGVVPPPLPDIFVGFEFTGPLRPYPITPRRKVPDSIPKPDYYLTGVPLSERDVKRNGIEIIKKPKDLAALREACRIGREVLDIAGAFVRAGKTTEEIDELVHNSTIERGAYPSPLNYRGFPKSCCTSVNEIVCHGIPDLRPLQNGDIVNVDVSVYHGGFHSDLNETYFVEDESSDVKVDPNTKLLVDTTYNALYKAIEYCKPGAMYRDIGDVIHKVVKEHGFSIIRTYCGHGLGRLFHCAPNVPHYPGNKAVGVMKPGHVFTIEPMINAGGWQDLQWPDNWTSATKDGKPSAQFEHTLLITDSGCEILTARTRGSYKDRFVL